MNYINRGKRDVIIIPTFGKGDTDIANGFRSSSPKTRTSPVCKQSPPGCSGAPTALSLESSLSMFQCTYAPSWSSSFSPTMPNKSIAVKSTFTSVYFAISFAPLDSCSALIFRSRSPPDSSCPWRTNLMSFKSPALKSKCSGTAAYLPSCLTYNDFSGTVTATVSPSGRSRALRPAGRAARR